LERVYIPSRVGDNRFLGEGYVAAAQGVRLERTGRGMARRGLVGYRGRVLRLLEHRKACHSTRSLFRRNGLRFRSADWGSAKPFSVGWWAVVGDGHQIEGRILPRGALVRYREWYGSSAPNVGLKLTAEQVAEGILARDGKDTIAYGVLDPAAFAVDGGPSIAERMAACTQGKVWFRRADNRRVAQMGALGGWDQMRRRLQGDGDGRPMLYTFSTCVDFIRTVPALQHDLDRPEDIDTDGEDHAGDEARYACMSRPWVEDIVKPKDVLAEMIKPKSFNDVIREFELEQAED
jgi:hypothetical protein